MFKLARHCGNDKVRHASVPPLRSLPDEFVKRVVAFFCQGGEVQIGRTTMTDDQLAKCLKSIGMACFVKHLDLFSDQKISEDSAVNLLINHEKYMESGSRTRVNQSRRIIREGRVRDALRMISQSKRVQPQWSDMALRLLAVNK